MKNSESYLLSLIWELQKHPEERRHRQRCVMCQNLLFSLEGSSKDPAGLSPAYVAHLLSRCEAWGIKVDKTLVEAEIN